MLLVGNSFGSPNFTPPSTPIGNGAFVSGLLHLTGQSEPLYITSTNMSSLSSSLGPRGENIILRKIILRPYVQYVPV